MPIFSKMHSKFYQPLPTDYLAAAIWGFLTDFTEFRSSWLSTNGFTIDPGKWLTSAIASLTAPLFNKGTNIANLKIAEARRQEAALRFEQSLLDAGNEVNNALARWQTAQQRIRLDEEQVADLECATEKSKLLMQYTTATYLEVLSAQQSLLNARLTLAQDRMEKIQAIISLYHALGGGVE